MGFFISPCNSKYKFEIFPITSIRIKFESPQHPTPTPLSRLVYCRVFPRTWRAAQRSNNKHFRTSSARRRCYQLATSPANCSKRFTKPNRQNGAYAFNARAADTINSFSSTEFLLFKKTWKTWWNKKPWPKKDHKLKKLQENSEGTRSMTPFRNPVKQRDNERFATQVKRKLLRLKIF